MRITSWLLWIVQGNDYGLAYMDLVTGEFQDDLNDFSMVCGEIRNLRAREVVLGYALPEQEERVFISQMNLCCHMWDGA